MEYRDIQCWAFCEDVHATLEDFQVETREWSQQEINDSIAELGEMILIMSAALAVWAGVVLILWP